MGKLIIKLYRSKIFTPQLSFKLRITYITYAHKSIRHNMSKKTLNLSIRESIKQRAKHMAKKRGISVSRLFEEMIIRERDAGSFIPPPGSGTAQFINAIPEENKVDDYDYKKLKAEILEEKYGDK